LKPIAQLSLFHSSTKSALRLALSANARERLEAVFLNHTFRWLHPGGVLFLVIPGRTGGGVCAGSGLPLQAVAGAFASAIPASVPLSPGPHCWRPAHSARARATSRSRDQRSRLLFHHARTPIRTISGVARVLRGSIHRAADRLGHTGFQGAAARRVGELDPTSLASRQAARILAPEPTVIGGRPLTPLHAGQVGLVAVPV